MTKKEWVQELTLRMVMSGYSYGTRDADLAKVHANYAKGVADAIEKEHQGFFDSPPCTYINRGPG